MGEVHKKITWSVEASGGSPGAGLSGVMVVPPGDWEVDAELSDALHLVGTYLNNGGRLGKNDLVMVIPGIN